MAQRGGRRDSLTPAGIAQGRETRPADDLGLGQQLADDRLQRVRAEDQRFLAAAGVEHAVGEDVTALGIDAELGFVDCGEGEIALLCRRGCSRLAWIRPCTGNSAPGRDDPFLASQQRDLLFALDGDDAVIDFARQQPQREADDAGRMTAHPLHRQVGLAGVGRSQDGPDRSVRTRRHDFGMWQRASATQGSSRVSSK